MSRPSPGLLFIAAVLLFGTAQWLSARAESVTTVQATGTAARISKEQATQNALKVLPGKVTDVTMERKRGKTVWVIEIVADKDGEENDVLVDMDSGSVLAVER